MLQAVSIAVTGLNTQSQRLADSAERVARFGTPTDSPDTGERAADVNLAREVVTQIEAETAFRANAAVIRTADEMLGTLLDVKA